MDLSDGFHSELLGQPYKQQFGLAVGVQILYYNGTDLFGLIAPWGGRGYLIIKTLTKPNTTYVYVFIKERSMGRICLFKLDNLLLWYFFISFEGVYLVRLSAISSIIILQLLFGVNKLKASVDL